MNMYKYNSDESNSEKETTISFDARQYRAKLLIVWLNNMASSSAVNEYTSWYQSLKTIYHLCAPYVNNTESQKVKQQLDKTKNVLNLMANKRNVSQNVIDNSFNTLTDLTLLTFKDQFMQTQTNEGGAFNIDDFDSGGD